MLFEKIIHLRQFPADTPDYDPVFYYYHSDHLGSSTIMTDRQGDIVQQYGYTAFGDEKYKNNTLAFSVTNRYTSQQVDEDTGLYFYKSRYGACPERSRMESEISKVHPGRFHRSKLDYLSGP